MAAERKGSTSYSERSTRPTTNRMTTSYSNPFYTTNDTVSRPRTGAHSVGRPSTARPRTGVSTLGVENQAIVCAVSESRGISPIVGLAFVNLDTGEAVLSQISDSQTYVKTVHKLIVFNPTTILVVSTAANPESKLFSILHDTLQELDQTTITLLDRRYWAETTGIEYIQQLAFAEDVESIKTAVSGNYYAVCSFAAALKYTELALSKTFPYRSLRVKYEPSEGSMMIDLSTIHSLELVQNLHHAKSRDCLFGLLNETLTPMGSRLVRSNILQPLTDPVILNTRYDALEELSTKEEMFFAVRQALKPFRDADKMLTQLILIPLQPDISVTQQAINNVIMLKEFVGLIKPVFEALTGARAYMLRDIQSLCVAELLEPIHELIDGTINEDTTYAKQPLDLRNQRTYAVKSGVNGLLDVARQTYKEAMTDAMQHITDMAEEHNLPLQTKFEGVRQFYIRLPASELAERDLPAVFRNVVRKKEWVECQTLDLMKRNQKISDSHNEVVLMSDKAVQQLIADVRQHMSVLFKVCEGVAMLDMICAFAQVVTSQDYVRPAMGDTLAIQAGRHPIREKIHTTKFIPNDVYATQQNRFQIITGCNMSGKSTYIRSIALMQVMAQMGSFVPAKFAAFPIMRQLFARISIDDNIEANVSTFAAEMRETAFILRNIDRHSMAIIDELGRGTSTRDGFAIALAIAEALVGSRALVWFATHFRDLANILAERNGVTNLHLAVDMRAEDRMEMLYRISQGTVQEAHYGLQLARVVPLPPDVVDYAEHVARTLEAQTKRRRGHSLSIITARRRRLLLNLKEHLGQAKNGKKDGPELMEWLKALQVEFVRQMSKLEDLARRAELGIAGEDEDDDGGVEEADGTELAPEDAASQADNGGSVIEGQSAVEQIWRDGDGIEHVDATEDGSRMGSVRSGYEMPS